MFWDICLKICYKILFISIFEIFKSENYWLVKCALIIGLNNSFTVFLIALMHVVIKCKSKMIMFYTQP